MTNPIAGRRRKGSVRFAPYFKVQVWQPVSLTWRDVQERHDTPEQAVAAYPPGETCRVMAITERGRAPLA